MIKKYIAPVLLAQVTIRFFYWRISGGDYPSLSFSIAIIFGTGPLWIISLTLLIDYVVTLQYRRFLSIYITTLLIGNSIEIYSFVEPTNILEFMFSTVGIICLLLISAMLFVMIISELRRSGSGRAQKP